MSDQETKTPIESMDQQADAATTPASPARPSTGASQAAGVLMGVKLPIRVFLGRTKLPLREVAQLGNGAVVELDCAPDDPVEIVVNDRVIAHGEVVVVSGNYGVRITKMASREENSETEGGVSDLFSLSQKLR